MFSSNTSQVAQDQVFIEDVFSTWLYTGNDSTQTITNGIDLSTKGGLTWIKNRQTADWHVLFDTNRTQEYALSSNSTSGQIDYTGAGVSQWNNNGFVVQGSAGVTNANNQRYVSWTFRKQPKFFDVVTYTGDGVDNRAIPHSLGAIPGCMVLKDTVNTINLNIWAVYHRALPTPQNSYLVLNATDANQTYSGFWGTSGPDANNFYIDAAFNESGKTYVVYLFAHDAGGFGLTGTDNVISCGSYTGTGSAQNISLGWEPQLVLIKNASATSNWIMLDTMRGFTEGNVVQKAILNANTSGAEAFASNIISITSTGFRTEGWHASGQTYIYIAIRRGPMKTPTTGTSVFSPNTASGTFAATITTNFPVDLTIGKQRTGGSNFTFDRLRGGTSNAYTYLETNSTAAETTGTGSGVGFDNNTGILANWSSASYVWWNFRRAPGFFDEVCYTGSGSNTQLVSHNLGVNPELIIQKRRDSTSDWYTAYILNGSVDKTLLLNSTAATGQTQTILYTTTSAIAAFDNSAGTISGATYVAYLFASCSGVSKVTNFTGTGSLQTINCGFTGGARLVLIKRTDASGDWYIWDSARGISSSTDPYLLLNSTAAEVTSTNWVDTTSTGFQVTAASGNNVNINGASYIALAIA